jgi:hypothetical protein
MTCTNTVTNTQTTNTPTITFTPTPYTGSDVVINHIPVPNPVRSDQAVINYVLGKNVDSVSFKVFTTAFRRIAQTSGTTQAGSNNASIDVSGFANGIYFYVLTVEADGQSIRKIGKFIILR